MRTVWVATLALLLLPLAAGFLVGQEGKADGLEARRKIWNSLPEAEKTRLREKFRHYQSLPDDEKEALKLRLGVLKELMEGEQEEIDPEERPGFERLDRFGRRRFLQQRVRGVLREGPEILKRVLGMRGDELDSRTLLDRAAEANSRLFKRALDHLVQTGALSPGERERVAQRFRRSTAFERVALVREYVIRNPRAFGFEETETERLRRAELPDFINVLQRRLFRVLPIPDSFRLTPEQRTRMRALPPRERAVKERELVLSNVIRTLRQAGVPEPLLDRLRETPPGRMIFQAKRLLERARATHPGRGPGSKGRRPLGPPPGRKRSVPGDGETSRRPGARRAGPG